MFGLKTFTYLNGLLDIVLCQITFFKVFLSLIQLLDDALEESYRSVLEESSTSETNKKNSSLNSDDGKNLVRLS